MKLKQGDPLRSYWLWLIECTDFEYQLHHPNKEKSRTEVQLKKFKFSRNVFYFTGFAFKVGVNDEKLSSPLIVIELRNRL